MLISGHVFTPFNLLFGALKRDWDFMIDSPAELAIDHMVVWVGSTAQTLHSWLRYFERMFVQWEEEGKRCLSSYTYVSDYASLFFIQAEC